MVVQRAIILLLVMVMVMVIGFGRICRAIAWGSVMLFAIFSSNIS